MEDQKYKSGEDKGHYKVVNQHMVLGGSAWDMKMDAQYSIYRPERHIDQNDPKVHLYNLKQKQSEIVGVNKGDYKNIIFEYKRHQYYFNNINPMDGSLLNQPAWSKPDLFSESKNKTDDPFWYVELLRKQN